MNTVYQRVLEFEKTNPTFQFNKTGLQLVGFLTRNEWMRQGGKIAQLDVTQQKERDGRNYMVLEYPTSFVPTIDAVIEKYVKRVIAKGLNKRKNEKPATSKQQNQDAVPSSSPPQRKRKRTPVDRPVKPAFSGRKLKK